MDFVENMNRMIGSELSDFKTSIQSQLQHDHAFLEKNYYCSFDGTEKTVLNYLIDVHKESNDEEESVGETADSCEDLEQEIFFVLEQMNDCNIGEPLHQAIALGKIKLAIKLLSSSLEFDLNQRDNNGYTLLYHVLNSRNENLLKLVLTKRQNLHATSRMKDLNMDLYLQPLFQAILLDFEYAITSLVSCGAEFTNYVGRLKETPILFACRLGKVNALQALLQLQHKTSNLEKSNANGQNAIELLCAKMKKKSQVNETIRGIAMLFCHGAEPPANSDLRRILNDHVDEIMKEIKSYAQNNPNLAEPLVKRCHQKETFLHKMIYTDHSISSSIMSFFCRPRETALDLEELLVDYTEELSEHMSPEKLYARFVTHYTRYYDDKSFTNPWSTMRKMISDGQADWALVINYAKENPQSRTALVLKDMAKDLPGLATNLTIAKKM